ncbi:hypothetical protein P389DRAFT_157380 [Cystobasidium minutum MCA 4210]|uniref:uncharacterized protein n=1 Tax=Cystobasidium minutum MCA 4210 TaxID=1397322 RepID=UPI0034CDDFE4|eukprot:jgi/Rhomi1/157380/estExt_Genewise1Plus.C_1_t30125
MAAAAVEAPSVAPNGHMNGYQGSSDMPDWPGRYQHVDKILSRPTVFEPDFAPGAETKARLREDFKILVVGAGGLGCEILTNLALLGFKDIHVIDLDTIDISNLNRQFLFRQKDVGQPKAEVAARFIMQRVPGVKVTPYFGKIQDKGDDYYMQFNIVVAGLDSIEARRWLNIKLVSLVDEENPESLKPMIDGGTEGFGGQARVILPSITACYECGLNLHAPRQTYPICTIQSTPRLPEHCIAWAFELEWPKRFGKEKKLDKDDPDHISWLYEESLKRAKAFGIEGVTWSLTQGVVKNIIPAIASTNAIISASICNEAFKIATGSAPYLQNYMTYSGTTAPYTYTFQLERQPHCPVCGGETIDMQASASQTLQDFLEDLKVKPTVQLSKPSLSIGGTPLFWEGNTSIATATHKNLDKTLGELLKSGDELSVTDPALPMQLGIRLILD